MSTGYFTKVSISDYDFAYTKLWPMTSASIEKYNQQISKPSTIELPAYGLDKSDIVIKEIGGELTVRSSSDRKTKVTLDKIYKLNNVLFKEARLELGVLFLEFIDSENVKRHEVV